MRAILSEDADIPGSHAAGDMFLCSVLAVPVAARLRARVRLPAVGGTVAHAARQAAVERGARHGHIRREPEIADAGGQPPSR